MPGPPPTPSVIRLMRGNPGKRAFNRHEPRSAIADAVPEPPDWLDAGYACDEWGRVAPPNCTGSGC
jgi:phage terminase small subunit